MKNPISLVAAIFAVSLAAPVAASAVQQTPTYVSSTSQAAPVDVLQHVMRDPTTNELSTAANVGYLNAASGALVSSSAASSVASIDVLRHAMRDAVTNEASIASETALPLSPNENIRSAEPQAAESAPALEIVGP